MEKLRELRKAKGLTLKELAKDLDITHQVLSRWELGNVEPDNRMLAKIADYFNVSVDYLLGRPEFPQIVLSSSPNIDWNFLFVEDSYLGLASLAYAVDFLNKAKETAITDTGIKKIEDYIQSAIHQLLDILTVSLKGHRIMSDSVEIIMQKGSIGYKEVLERLGLTDEQIDRLYNEVRYREVLPKKKP